MPNYIDLLNLEKHIEGGYFAVFYKSKQKVYPISKGYSNENNTINTLSENQRIERSASTSIYFLLEKENFSAWHRLKSDEIWHYYDGGSEIDIHTIDKDGNYEKKSLGNSGRMQNASFYLVIKAGTWFAAEVRNKLSFGLVGCTVAPGFEFSDFELAKQSDLVAQYPDLTPQINKFIHTHDSSNDSQMGVVPAEINRQWKLSSKDYIKQFNLERHVEGGYFSECYRSEHQVLCLDLNKANNDVLKDNLINRSAGSSIYFLLEENDYSAWHTLTSDEIWHYYDGGSPIDLHTIDKDGNSKTYTLGNPSICKDASFQVVISAGDWFSAEVRDKTSFALVGCTVSPGFEYQDFELANRKTLLSKFPQHENIINKFTQVPSQPSKSWTTYATKYAVVALVAGIGLFSILNEKSFISNCATNIRNKLGM